jgi:hypothetical protein
MFKRLDIENSDTRIRHARDVLIMSKLSLKPIVIHKLFNPEY